jgi:dihydroorotate dehydrogenase electron transfer subunit
MKGTGFKPFEIEDVASSGDGKTKVFTFKQGMDYKPGNFAMAWVPRVSANPLAIVRGDKLMLAVKLNYKGKKEESFTWNMIQKKKGEHVFVDGPLGKGSFYEYCDDRKPIVLVGGGIGIAPLASVLPFVYRENVRKVFLGFGSCDEMVLMDMFDDLDTYVSTDDGTYGRRGLVTDFLDDAETLRDSRVFICGPEAMMKTAAEKAMRYTDPKDIVLSVERYMKCGRGICGNCDIHGREETYLVCADGPVFTYDQLMGGDLGTYRRSRSGHRTPLDESGIRVPV